MTRFHLLLPLILAAAATLAPHLLVSQTPGHADLCVFRGGRFLCDTANDGGTAELRLRFGGPGDLPFLADFNGDGRWDPCIFRDHHFRCDTARDGVGLESTFFVPSGVQPLIGDVDGDGQADPCYRQGRRWICHVFEPLSPTDIISWSFGSATDPGLLGDVDGDGDADPCVFWHGRFVCRTFREQDGTAAVLTLDLRSALSSAGNGTPLLGDVNGDGRADPCFYSGGRLVCGVFPPGTSRPARIVTLAFGVAGDIPVLGDVDGF
jgi:hypothetical protein